MKLKSFLTGALILAALPSIAFASTKKTAKKPEESTKTQSSTGSGPNPFSDCGIGAALFKTNKVLAVTSNVIWDVGTTAVTSATASPETCSGKNVTAARFILDSYDSLAEETARGTGEHLAALMNIMDVEQSSQAQVIANLRKDMAANVTKADYVAANKVDKSSQFYSSFVAAIPAV